MVYAIHPLLISLNGCKFSSSEDHNIPSVTHKPYYIILNILFLVVSLHDHNSCVFLHPGLHGPSIQDSQPETYKRLWVENIVLLMDTESRNCENKKSQEQHSK